MKLALKLVPKGVQERAQPMVRRAEAFVRDFEWTWTKAVIAALVLWLVALAFLAVVPSWWLYFAEDTLGWGRESFWLFKLRDLVAVILFSIPFGGFIMVPLELQRWRRRLRSESESRPTGGYR
jgi:hypothetical protein